jgi:hypothetical protein
LEPPNNRLDDVDDLILPSEKLCETLDGHLRKGVGCVQWSILLPACNDLLLSRSEYILSDAHAPSLKPVDVQKCNRGCGGDFFDFFELF